jgi:hypothetical protein
LVHSGQPECEADLELEDSPRPTAGEAPSPRDRLARLALIALPVVLALVGYYPGVLQGKSLPQPNDDGDFYVYQLVRAYEAGGRWWTVARDDRVGWPYPSEVARHAGLFEGVDLMLLAAALGRWLQPLQLYHLAVIAALAVNGWVASWIVYRGTRSYLWAAVSCLLITLNTVVGGRVNCHLHLFKYGWPLLVIWALSRYLDAPTRRRGVLLGLASAWAMQGSFYLGLLLLTGVGAWWLGCLISGRLVRAHVAATAAAGVAFLAASAALLFSVWTVAKRALGSEEFFHRTRFDTWQFTSELWQYFVPKWSEGARTYVVELQRARDLSGFGEGWNYLGLTVLLGVAVYLIARARGVRFQVADPRFLDRCVGLMGVFVCLSLAGGPSYFLYDYVGSLRAYGRAGMIAFALGCVAAPMALSGLVNRLRLRAMRAAAVGFVIALAAVDAYQSTTIFSWWGDVPEPEWAAWLAEQPKSVRLAAFPPKRPDPFRGWGVVSLVARIGHGHATLNGSDFRLLEADLRLLGATYDQLNPDALRFIASLGYRSLAFHAGYLAANPWIEKLPWLAPGEQVGPWRVFRYVDAAPRFLALSVDELLARLAVAREPARVPPRAWITGRLDLPETVVLAEPSRGTLTWVDSRGRTVDAAVPFLFQHVYGPGIPAYVVRTPKEPGHYTLRYQDDRGRSLTLKAYDVDPQVATCQRAFDRKLPEVLLGQLDWPTRGDRPSTARVTIQNASPYYIQAETHREKVSTSAHPGINPASAGALILHLESYRQGDPRPYRIFDLPLPGDLPPKSNLSLDIPADWYSGIDEPVRVVVTPHFVGLGQRIATGQDAQVRFADVEDRPR